MFFNFRQGLYFPVEIRCLFPIAVALWSTRQTEDTKDNRELHVKTTLREMCVFVVFLVVLCIGESYMLFSDYISLNSACLTHCLTARIAKRHMESSCLCNTYYSSIM